MNSSLFLNFYGLREQPFGVTPDPRYVYAAPRYKQALVSLLSTVENELGFCAMVAAPGLGKTTLLFQLLETLRTRARTAFVFQTLCGPDELLHHILLELDLRIGQARAAQLHVAFNDFLVAQAHARQRVVIVLDEAQNLPEESLEFVRLLTNFETPCRKLLTVVLSGQPQLADKLSDPSLAQLGQRIATAIHLTPFTQPEVAEYVKHRLRVAGHPTGDLFDGTALAEITACTFGIPRMINHVCFNALALGSALGHKKIGGEIVCEAAAGLDFRLKGAAAATSAVPTPMLSSAAATLTVAAMQPRSASGPVFGNEHKTEDQPLFASSQSGLQTTVSPQRASTPQEPMLTLATQDTRSEVQRQLVLGAVMMVIIGVACLIWFVAKRATIHAASAKHEQSMTQQAAQSIADQDVHKTSRSRPRPGIRTKRLRMEELAHLATQLVPTYEPPMPATNLHNRPDISMRIGQVMPILQAGIQPSSTVPATLRQALRPPYPDSARQGGVGGRVVVEAIIDEDGRVSDARVVEGNPQFQAATEAAVKQWIFSPAQVDGQAVPSKATIEFYFHAGSTRQNQTVEKARAQ